MTYVFICIRSIRMRILLFLILYIKYNVATECMLDLGNLKNTERQNNSNYCNSAMIAKTEWQHLFIFIFNIYTNVLPICISEHVSISNGCRNKGGHWLLWNWSLMVVVNSIIGAGSEPRPSSRDVSTLNHKLCSLALNKGIYCTYYSYDF